MKLQLLMATVNDHFLQRGYIPPFENYLVINQIHPPWKRTQKAEYPQDHVLEYQEKGISRSRNRAVQQSNSEIVLIADDDLVFMESAESIVVDAFNKNPTADIITFQTQTPQGTVLKRYGAKQKWHDAYSIMHVTSYDIAFRVQSIQAADLKFDERFGLGADFPTGEENIFLLDALRKKLKILYLPIPIAVHPEHSSGGDFLNEDLIVAKGAMLCRMFGGKSYLAALLFACKKYRLSTMSCCKFYRLMCHGISLYKKQTRAAQYR